ncbi:porin family protein [Spirosoma endophyticum]|uniref:Outer membrane protein beta-barrel domain-containing protein n=1 Tax=Spirosoma endophyticum TaxID=662367 RepID=A0A1I1VWF5_9BACT|nr:porin family protein [Spirosoma endophyticum]SFD87436.1 Outer membrane protein beta-barrel domain-containing protein [Spirosoma endophyticum]
MKKSVNTLLLAAVLTIGAFTLNSTDAVAQGRTRVGIKGGLNASSLYYDSQGVSNKNERIGFHLGVFAQAPIGEFFAIQPELLYTTKGASADYNVLGLNGKNTFKLNYAELPVLATFKLGQSVEIQAGPYVSYLLNSSISSNESFQTTIGRGNFNKVDYGLAGGLNLYFGKAFIGARYEQGFKQIASSGAAQTLLGNAKNGVGLLSVGFSLN